MKNKLLPIFTGVLISSFIAIISIYFSALLGTELFGFKKSPVSPILLAIIIGIFISNTSEFLKKFDTGIKFCIKHILKLGIILMGIRLGLSEMLGFGVKSLIIVTPCIILTVLLIKKSASIFKLKSTMATLIAVGTSICGASAIVATAPAISAKDEEVVFAIANISIFGIVAMFLYPFVANVLFPLDSISAGIFLGSSIHETAQVAGAGIIYSDQFSQPQVLDIATLTKLIRNTAMIIVIPFLSYQSTTVSRDNSFFLQIKSIFPYFILGFIAFGIFRTIGDVGMNDSGLAFGFLDASKWKGLIYFINNLSKFLLTIAMSALGMSTNVEVFRSIGIKVFYYGLTMSFFVGLVSLVSISILI